MKTDELLLRQTRMRFPRLDFDRVQITPIEKGGSDRRFYRMRVGGAAGDVGGAAHSLILVKYNLEREENRHYVRIAEFLGANAIRVPKIYFHDPTEGLIWIEDLGEEDLFSHRGESWLVRRSIYESALDEVAKLHRLGPDTCAAVADSLPAEFNAALYRWEQQYFFENCLGRYFKVAPAQLDKLGTSDSLDQIADRLDRLPRVLVHRDFQSQNIIVRKGQAYLIDFQGMRPGLAQYDLASLLYDPYVDLGDAERDELLAHYCGGKVADEFREVLQLCALQRLMQALGAYGFLGLSKGHKHFLQYIPHAMALLRGIVARIDNLRPLARLLGDIA